MAVRIVEERHPQIVIIHLGDEVRLMGEANATLCQFHHRQGYIRTPKVNASLRPEITRRLYFVEQQTHAGTIEKRQIAKAVKLPQTYHFLVENLRAISIDHRQSDLTDLTEIELHRSLRA
jgi:hypothetical protein